MKLFVISDTHGKTHKVFEIFKQLNSIDAIIHLGDYQEDADIIAKTLNINIISVKGNTDGANSKNDYKILESPYGKIYLSHGHMENVKIKYDNIYYRTLEEGCKAAFFGHTHTPIFEKYGDIYLINPGSISLPSDGGNGSYAIVYLEENSISGSICQYSPSNSIKSTETNDKAKFKSQGGFLRNILNNSDRF